jgi:hypothetical protein
MPRPTEFDSMLSAAIAERIAHPVSVPVVRTGLRSARSR